MIHLAGDNPVKQALQELDIFEEEGIDGAIIENYDGSYDDVESTLRQTAIRDGNVVIGVNILPNDFTLAFRWANRYVAQFIQLDYVAGRYECRFGNTKNPIELELAKYTQAKEQFPDIVVLGGVHPKYHRPFHDSNLIQDLKEGMERAEAIVVTGAGTGQPTTMPKITYFRKILGTHPLIVGAGMTPENAYEQLSISDGAIVGSSLKPNGNTENPIDRGLVRAFMAVVKQVRQDHAGVQ